MKLDKTTTTLMKGYGILFIALHNLLHNTSLTGFIKENENTFDVQRTSEYLASLKTFDWSDFGQFFSFLGWIGMPVFLFVSGYGLVKKFEKDDVFPLFRKYIFYSWKKLAMLLLPGAMYFVSLSIASGTYYSIIPKTVLQLTLLNNFLVPMLSFSPGVYWYFGITFELYILYFLVCHWDFKKISILLVGLVLIQLITVYLWGPESSVWSWVRHNFTGWGQVFLMGMVVAKTDFEKYLPQKTIMQLLSAVICLVLLPVLMLNKWTWLLFVPFVALLFFVFLAGVITHTCLLKKIGLWLGAYSSFIFVAHPIARSLVRLANDHLPMPLWLITIIYVVLFVIGAIVIKPLYQRLMNFKFVKAKRN